MRNQNSRFALAPTLNIGRSKFSLPCDRKLSADIGECVPFYWTEYLPGDTVEIKTNKVIRLQTPITPFMDNIYADFHWFSIPMRLVWEHTKEFFGENTESAWIPSKTYSMPQVTAPASTGWSVGTIADHLGLPVGVPGISVSALPFRAVALVYNEFFRSETLQDPFNIPVGDATTTGSNGTDFVNDVVKGGMPFIAGKFADYFTSNLPGMQRGPSVQIPLTDNGNFPVFAMSEHAKADYPTGVAPLRWKQWDGNSLVENPEGEYYQNISLNPTLDSGSRKTVLGSGGNNLYSPTLSLSPDNLWAVNNGQLVGASISALRTAFQIQRMYEAEARFGGRYTEIIKGHFGVTSPDSRLQRPEYLGGNRIPITVNQVIQQSSTDATSPQGNVAAMSLTVDSHHDFKRSFTEHGFIIGFVTLRYDHTYQQGIERAWSRLDKWDYYWPTLAHLSEQATLEKEIYATGVDDDDNAVFGYQERYAEYRYKPSYVSGEMRSAATNSLDSWHLADDYASAPALSDEWIREDKANVDRVLAVQSSVANQFFADIYVQNWSIRPIPVFGVPGLMDHF